MASSRMLLKVKGKCRRHKFDELNSWKWEFVQNFHQRGLWLNNSQGWRLCVVQFGYYQVVDFQSDDRRYQWFIYDIYRWFTADRVDLTLDSHHYVIGWGEGDKKLRKYYIPSLTSHEDDKKSFFSQNLVNTIYINERKQPLDIIAANHSASSCEATSTTSRASF